MSQYTAKFVYQNEWLEYPIACQKTFFEDNRESAINRVDEIICEKIKLFKKYNNPNKILVITLLEDNLFINQWAITGE